MIDWSDKRMVGLKCEFSNEPQTAKHVAAFNNYQGESSTYSYCETDSCWIKCKIVQGERTRYDGTGQPISNGVNVRIWTVNSELRDISIKPAEEYGWNIIGNLGDITHYQVMETEEIVEPEFTPMQVPHCFKSKPSVQEYAENDCESCKFSKECLDKITGDSHEALTFGPIDQHEPGAKLDHGKPRVSLVLDAFALALLEVAKVGTMGANKYSDNGWVEVKDGIKRYSDASGRHQLYKASGESHDPESGLLHQAHKAWNELAVLELMLKEQ